MKFKTKLKEGSLYVYKAICHCYNLNVLKNYSTLERQTVSGLVKVMSLHNCSLLLNHLTKFNDYIKISENVNSTTIQSNALPNKIHLPFGDAYAFYLALNKWPQI